MVVLITDGNSGHITVKEQVYSKDIALSSVSKRLLYLPREFTQVIVFAVYIPPSANADAACDVLPSVTSSMQTQHPQALFLISGDFNHSTLSSTLPTFTQYVTCHTIDNRTLDFMPTTRTHTTHSPSLLSDDLTTTWCISCLFTSPLLTGNQWRPAQLRHGLRSLKRL